MTDRQSHLSTVTALCVAATTTLHEESEINYWASVQPAGNKQKTRGESTASLVVLWQSCLVLEAFFRRRPHSVYLQIPLTSQVAAYRCKL